MINHELKKNLRIGAAMFVAMFIATSSLKRSLIFIIVYAIIILAISAITIVIRKLTKKV
jgi:hypothetical protein